MRLCTIIFISSHQHYSKNIVMIILHCLLLYYESTSASYFCRIFCSHLVIADLLSVRDEIIKTFHFSRTLPERLFFMGDEITSVEDNRSHDSVGIIITFRSTSTSLTLLPALPTIDKSEIVCNLDCKRGTFSLSSTNLSERRNVSPLTF